jgi:hypothetical protein
MLSPLIKFNYSYDKQQLLTQALDMNDYTRFKDPKTGFIFNSWFIKHCEHGYAIDITNEFKNMFEIKECKPRFYIQEAGFSLGFHKDRNTLCSFNFILSDDPDPINFRGYSVNYTQGLLNTQVDHAVLSTKNKRILFKISVFDKSFEEISNVLPYKLSV